MRATKKAYFKPPSTSHEVALYKELKAIGYKVFHNHKLHGYYPDLFLPDYRLIIEVDGGVHNIPEVHARDKIRSTVLEKYKYAVVRIKNEEIDKSIAACIKKIQSKITELARGLLTGRTPRKGAKGQMAVRLKDVTPFVAPNGEGLSEKKLALLQFIHESGYSYQTKVPMHGITIDYFLPENRLLVLVFGGDDPLLAGKTKKERLRLCRTALCRIGADKLKVLLFQEREFERIPISTLKKKLRQNAPLRNPRRLVDDPTWEALACEKLGIEQNKPKTQYLELPKPETQVSIPVI